MSKTPERGLFPYPISSETLFPTQSRKDEKIATKIAQTWFPTVRPNFTDINHKALKSTIVTNLQPYLPLDGF